MRYDTDRETFSSAESAAKLFWTMAVPFFTAFGARFMAYCKAQQMAWTDPLSALADRTSLL